MEACNNDMPEQTSSNIQYVDLISNQKEHKKKKNQCPIFALICFEGGEVDCNFVRADMAAIVEAWGPQSHLSTCSSVNF